MVEPRHLRNAPIAEAIVDLRAVLPPGFDPNRLRAAKDRLPDYPKFLERTRFEAGIQFSPGVPPQRQTRNLGLHGIFLSSSDDKMVAQFRVDGFTLNRLKPYTSWDEHLEPEVLRLWSVYRELAQPLAVTRIGLRYITQIPLPPSGSLDSFISTGPVLPAGIPKFLGGFRTQVAIEDHDRKLGGVITQVLDTDPAEPSLLLDIDVFSPADSSPMEGAPLVQVLRDLHDYKNRIFFGSLTPQFVEQFA